MSEHALNATAASLLGFLHRGPMTGWDLVRAAEEAIGDFWPLTQSQVYRELSAMTSAGLVAVQEPGPRDRKPYALTDTGRAAFAAWIDHEPRSETIRFPLLLTLFFGGHVPPERLAEFLQQHRAIHADRLADYESLYARLQEDGADVYALATLNFGRFYERAVLDWFATLPSTVTASDH